MATQTLRTMDKTGPRAKRDHLLLAMITPTAPLSFACHLLACLSQLVSRPPWCDDSCPFESLLFDFLRWWPNPTGTKSRRSLYLSIACQSFSMIYHVRATAIRKVTLSSSSAMWRYIRGALILSTIVPAPEYLKSPKIGAIKIKTRVRY